MQNDINILKEWFYNNLLSINSEQIKYIIFHSSNQTLDTINHDLYINQTIVEKVDNKYLGLILQSSMKWNLHIDSIKRVTSITCILRRLSYSVPNNFLKSIYYAHVHSKLNYLCPVWGCAAQKNSKF